MAIIALINSRNEREVLAFPRHVYDRTGTRSPRTTHCARRLAGSSGSGSSLRKTPSQNARFALTELFLYFAAASRSR